MPVHVKNIVKAFGPEVIFSDFSIDLPGKGCVCFFGPSGSGKTTLFNLLAGILRPDSGSIEFSGGEKVSFVFQEDRLLPWSTAADNIEQVLDPKTARPQALEWLRRVGLEQAADKLPGALSGGMRQRVAIARALAYGGDILLLDEPFQGIDAQNRDAVFSLISAEKEKHLVVLVTHYAEEALRLSDVIYAISGPPVKIEDTIEISETLRFDPVFREEALTRLGVHAHSPLPAG